MKRKTLVWLVIVSFILLVGVVVYMSQLRPLLVVPGKTNALLSLEFGATQQRIEFVIDTWKQLNKLDTAKQMNVVDFGLIVFYGSFLILSILLIAQYNKKFTGKYRNWLLGLALFAIVADFIEGIASIFWLDGKIDSVSPPVVAVLAAIKFVIVVPLLLGILVYFAYRLFGLIIGGKSTTP